MPGSGPVGNGDRPDPDALLRQAAQEGIGRLKAFLGAAPGVGKTFEVLSEGASRKCDGIDVVIRVVEMHGWAETEALNRGHEIIVRRDIPYEGRVLHEIDLDAVLDRAPRLVPVDELTHTNAPGSRHPKRFQDVEELLKAGIDVYSTINIHYVESLNDVVASFTRVSVRKTVPDSVLEMAEIEVVDIPPDELIERLKAGKVYLQHEATRALGHFFSKSNLSALRELSLRRAAQAVDAQMLEYLCAIGVGGTWARGDRIVVAINLLDMARVEAGALKLNVGPVDLSDAVTSATHDARRALEGHAVRLNVPPDLPLIRADPPLIHHCLLNLLDNAGREGEVFETFRRLEGSDRTIGAPASAWLSSRPLRKRWT